MKVVLDEGAILPTKAHDTDAGFDLYSPINTVVPPISVYWNPDENGMWNNTPSIGTAVIDTGVHVELPKGTCGLIVSKSGMNVNHGILSTGLIDEGYTGSIVVKLYNNTTKPYYISKGSKITQLVVLPVVNANLEVVDKLEDTDRGEKGFGSSGK